MRAPEIIDKTREYLDYLEEHINNVHKAWVVINENCQDMKFIYDDSYYNALVSDIDCHDLSKFSDIEFMAYRKKFFPVANEPVSSSEFDAAWAHHKKCNPHHWQNWAAENVGGQPPNEWVTHCVHMVCDWMAMGYTFNDTAREYYEKNKETIKVPDCAVKLINEIFDRVYGDAKDA